MDIEAERRIIRLFEAAMEQPPAARAAWLSAELADEPETRAAVEAMIRADQSAALLPTLPPEPAALRPETAMPERIGQYRLIEEIGRGGMGLVYRAVRDDGLFEQQVAIKIIRGTIFSASTLEQFARERRILARLHHPHIAQLLDGGVEEGGASFIIMELIDGQPITDHAHEQALGLDARLALFLQACDAIDYAHRNLIVHADVKPGNVMVAEGFGVKLLDFGIARLMGEEGSAAATAHTPGYSSPARLAGERSTPTDDIFGLGVLLRDLTADVDGVDADLSAIIAKAAEPDAAIRYASARELIEDLGRWQRHVPVRARPPSQRRALFLLWRRNRLLMSFALTLGLVLIGTAVLTSLLYVRADTQRRAAEARFAEVRSLSDFMLGDALSELEAVPGSGPLRQRMAERARIALDRLGQVPGAPLEVQAETANAYARVGEILAAPDLKEVNDPARGDAVLATAERQLRALITRLPARDDLRLALARTLVARAVYQGTAKVDKAKTFRALDEAEALLAPLNLKATTSRDAALVGLEALILRGYVHADALDYRASRAVLEKALAVAGRITPSTQRERVALAMKKERIHTLIGDARWYTGDQPGALLSYQRGMAEYDRTDLGTDIRIVKRQAYGAYTVASSLFALGRKAEALDISKRGLAAVARMREFDDSASARRMGNIVREEYMLELEGLGRLDEAIKQGEIVIAEFRETARLLPNDYQAQRSLPVDLLVVGNIHAKAGNRATACAMYKEADTLWSALEKAGRVPAFDRDNDVARTRARLKSCARRG